MRKWIWLTALALALPAAAQAQEAPRGMGARGPMLNSVEWLLNAKTEFNATPEQVTGLEAIARKFDTETAKLREEFQKLRLEMRGSADRQTIMQKMRPMREELQKKDDAAVAEAMKLLNAEQKKTVESLLESRREQMRNRTRTAPRRDQIQ